MNKIQNPKKGKNGSFRHSRFSIVDFTQNLNDRKILKFPLENDNFCQFWKTCLKWNTLYSAIQNRVKMEAEAGTLPSSSFRKIRSRYKCIFALA